MKQATLLIPFVVFLSVTALPPNLRRQADPDDPCLDETPTLDGPTSDNSAGIGVEFESSYVLFNSPGCTPTQTWQAKGKQVGGRSGNDWQLTADTTQVIAGRLTAEYILNGKTIKIGTGAASAAAAAVSSDIIAWNPYSDMPDNNWDIQDNECNPWKVISPKLGGTVGSLVWSTQVTAPLPFEAINDLFVTALDEEASSSLLPAGRAASRNVVSVTHDFFQSKPNGISPDSVKADVLGFLSLVMSYAKFATPLVTDERQYMTDSPKKTISIMPRTDFVTLYAQVQSTLLPGSGTLYNLVKTLACYKNYYGEVNLDEQFCGGTVAVPEPKPFMDSIGWCLINEDNKSEKGCITVEDWMTSIASGSAPDALTILDRQIDGQIGGLGTALENVMGTTRAVPLFEFRELSGVPAGRMPNAVSNAENALINYHKTYTTPPQRKMVKRQTDIYGCPTTAAASSTTPTPTPTPTPSCTLQNEDPDQGIFTQGCICGSTTLSLLNVTSATDPAQSCAYTALPTTTGVNPITILSSTYTSECQVCTLVGGIADTPTCSTITGCENPTPPPTPTPAATSTTPAAPTLPPPTCVADEIYESDPTCGGKCNGPTAKCECQDGKGIFGLGNKNACICKC